MSIRPCLFMHCYCNVLYFRTKLHTHPERRERERERERASEDGKLKRISILYDGLGGWLMRAFIATAAISAG